MQFDLAKSKKLTKITKKITAARIKQRKKQIRDKTYLNTIARAMRYFCTHTTIHGLRYVVDPHLHMIERFLWLVVFLVCSAIASTTIYSLALRFQVNRK